MSRDKFEFEPLQHVKNFLDLEPALYGEFKEAMNEAITTYNTSKRSAKRIEALHDMEFAIGRVTIYQPPLDRKSFSGFYLKQIELVSQMKMAYLRESINPKDLFLDRSDIAQIVSSYQMSAPKARDLVNILMRHSDNLANELFYLYGLIAHEPEAYNWSQFIANHTFTYLGGAHSNVYWVKNTLNQSGRLLKVENRLQQSRQAAAHLRAKLPHLFPPLEVLRPVEVYGQGKESKEIVTRYLLVTQYCTGGSLTTHRQHIKNDGKAAIYAATATIMRQMTEAFIDILNEEACFSDFKIDNWGIDAQLSQIQVIDDKGLVPTENGRYYSPNVDKIWIPHTLEFDPREIYDASFDAEKFQAFGLGVNIAYYLTDADLSDATPDYSLFSGELGVAFAHLVSSLTKEDPAQRMSLSEALILLRVLECKTSKEYQDICSAFAEKNQTEAHGLEWKLLIHDFLKTQASQKSFSAKKTLSDLRAIIGPLKEKITFYHRLCKSLEKLKYGSLDKKVDDFIQSCDDALMQAGSYSDIMAILDQKNELLTRAIAGLSRPEHLEIKSRIQEYQRHPFWIQNKSTRADDILKAMRDVPIMSRVDLLSDASFKDTRALWEALSPKTFASVHMQLKKKICRSPAADMLKKFQEDFQITPAELIHEHTAAPSMVG